IFAEHIVGLLIVFEQLVNQVCLNGRSSSFLSLYGSMAVYTKSFTPSQLPATASQKYLKF
ncbi:MAG TPA: hypothetical protein VNN73_23095, partial [Blastocatellia bacterium]|nr:hypothetical protein [Blastocatellia bacterium]